MTKWKANKVSQHFENLNTIPPNELMQNKDFFISYNNTDTALYGCDITALVDITKGCFLILNGDHREAYANLISEGYNTCLNYFKKNIKLINKLSDIKKLKEYKL